MKFQKGGFMTMITNDIKQKLGEQTQKLEAKASEL